MKWLKHIQVFFLLSSITLTLFAQKKDSTLSYKPLVNQAGYNVGEVKRFVCYGIPDAKVFKIINTSTKKVEYTGKTLNFQGWFTEFDPVASKDEYIVDIEGYGQSVPFWIADHLIEKLSSKLAYDFFVDVRGFADLDKYNMTKIYGGGPSRDGGAYGLETVFEILQYAANPALYDNWKKELKDSSTADLIDLIKWHGAFAAKYVNYNEYVGYRHGSLGYEGQPRMTYDYWNTLDQLAAVCGAYHSFLKSYISKEDYQRYRKLCLDNWEKYDRHKVVRYWTYSTKWVDQGFQEFNEMGNAFGQSVFSNLFMYLCEKNEKDGQPEKFLKYAQESAEDIIKNWDFNNPRHMWWIRNAEHITPQALAWFLMIAPDKAPKGTKEKLQAWAQFMKQKTNNFWKYRVHSETEWAHPKTKELGGAPALAGSMFAVSHLLNDQPLRALGWNQIDFVFGVNPVGAHLSNKSDDRLKIGGYWAGVEDGWPQSHTDGYGLLGLVRGTLDGSPLDGQFPIAKKVEKVEGKNDGQVFGKNAYATEGWCISNRGWQASLTFATLGTHKIELIDPKFSKEISSAAKGQTIQVKLSAALNQDWNKIDEGWVDVYDGEKKLAQVKVYETDVNSGVFIGTYTLTDQAKSLTFSYGYLGFETRRSLLVKK